MAAISFVRPLPSALTGAGKLWLPELNIRLWRMTYGAFSTAHRPAQFTDSASPSSAVSWTTLRALTCVFPDDWGIDTSLVSTLKMRIGIRVRINPTGGPQTDWLAKMRIESGDTAASVSGSGSSTNTFVTRTWTTLPTGATTINVQYELTASINSPGDEGATFDRPDDNAADCYVAFLE